MTRQEIAREMLESTIPYKGTLEDFHFSADDHVYTLWEMVSSLVRHIRGTENRELQCFGCIGEALADYCRAYPAPFSYKKRMRLRFYQWMMEIRERYGLTGAEIDPELEKGTKEDDKVIGLVKALHDREGITRAELADKLGVSGREISKDLKRLNDGRPEPFRIGGQPVLVKTTAERKVDKKEAYWSTRNTMHPIILQENVIQTGVLIQSLARNFFEYEAEVSLTIALDIWNQLTEYAQGRVREVFAKDDPDMRTFIELLEDDLPGERIAGFMTEREMMRKYGGNMDLETERIFLEKVPGRERED